MSELEGSREKITEIDSKMAELFEERMGMSRKVAEYKKARGLSVKDKAREEALIERNKALIKDDEIRPFYVNYIRSTQDISCEYQEMLMNGLKIAYGGEEGAYAHIAARRMFPKARYISKTDHTDAYRSVESGECDLAVLPIENSIAGEVGTVMDLMYQGSLFVNQVYDFPIGHQLLGISGSSRESIRKVISHPQAIAQCSGYLKKMGFEVETASSTSAAAKQVISLGDPSVGAVASEEAAEIFGLDILDRDVQNQGINTTRFAAFSRSMNSPAAGSGSGENFIMVFTVKNEAGALASTLNIIGAHGYNMRNLKSRPLKSLPWNYYFYIEAEGDVNSQNGKDMLRELSVLCADLKLVGVFR